MHRDPLLKRITDIKSIKAFVLPLLLSVLIVTCVSIYFGISPQAALKQTARVIGSSVSSKINASELSEALQLEKNYQLGKFDRDVIHPEVSWRELASKENHLVFGSYSGPTRTYLEVPFIFEEYNVKHIKALRERYQIEELASGERTEYEAMLKVASWVGNLWDHGIDTPLNGPQNFKAIDAIESAKNGARYWCEISARSMSQVATALGWPSRVITLSRSGYEWQHAVTEVWSNQFTKWFVIDTDFNVIYESNGIPLSAFELVHEGKMLQRLGRLAIKNFTPLKPFFVRRGGKMREMQALEQLRFYNYAHMDMRNDWASRKLSRGSPVGGDRATYFTSNAKISPILNAFRRASTKRDFDWPVNLVEIHLVGLKVDDSKVVLEIDAKAYGPYANYIQIRIDRGTWQNTDPGLSSYQLTDGIHSLEARLALINDTVGPTTNVTFSTRLEPQSI
ncbi:MAG: transglutaminase domain-containing protein [Pseudomonadales bacterium]